MAFAARLGPLTSELVEAVTHVSSQRHPERHKHHRDVVLRKLKSHPFLRTNQFEVANTLDGLEERFRVNNRDDLADNLHERLEKLQEVSTKWHPEILFLLLELSDQPTFNTELADLELLRESEEDLDPALLWETIAKEDGWDQDAELWKSIKYSDSSDDDMSYANTADGSDSISETDPSDAEGPLRTTENKIVHPEDESLFNSVRESQSWRTAKPATDASGRIRKVGVSEAHVLREVLFMLQGLETTLFDRNIVPVPSFQISHIVWDTHRALINTFAEFGRRLAPLRIFMKKSQDLAHIQAFQDSIGSHLLDFDQKLSEIHSRLACPQKDEVVSLMALKTELTPWLRPLHALADVVTGMNDTSDSGAFRHLELLYQGATLAQSSEDTLIYVSLARVFAECFNVYLRPIRLWMDEGKLQTGASFFIYETSAELTLSRIWSDRFKFRTGVDGGLYAPGFLRPAASKIMNAGKNTVVLKRLEYQSILHHVEEEEPPLDYDSICPAGFEFVPFPDLFAAAFERWVQSKYRSTSTTLKTALFEQCALFSNLDSLERLYFMSDGSASTIFHEAIFAKIDSLDPSWRSRYFLTAIAQEAFGALLDADRLIVSVDKAGIDESPTSARDSVRSVLPHVRVNYRLTWPVQMILSSTSMENYQKIFSLLLQFKRAAYELHKPKILDHYWTDHEDWEARALYYSCRTRILWFCNTMQNYISTLVVTPHLLEMRQKLREAQDVDALIIVHDTFLKNIVDGVCLGARLELIRECMSDIMDLAIKLEQLYAGNTTLEVLNEIQEDFERHLRFITEGLRSVARAKGDSQSAKWDTLAEMLQMGNSR
ncbi:unnamed protein product [Clonostachys rosea]|uniref:Spindle pole body component n=1 Tax=Bionectria ochroleuca TaxID=29856 RepID=A0ABY6TW57_BIOOC|nr:unnamed protein product [Clonostachys rosea]